jgi:Siphovirus Gp157
MSLHKETEAARLLLAQMADIIGDDEEARRGLVEGETNLHEAVSSAIKMIGEDKAAIAAIKEYACKLGDRAGRLEKRVENTRTAIAVAMDLASEKSIQTPFGTVSLKDTPRIAVVTEESDIPSTFWKPQPNKLDKTALTKALREGQAIPGASLSNGGTTIAIKV